MDQGPHPQSKAASGALPGFGYLTISGPRFSIVHVYAPLHAGGRTTRPTQRTEAFDVVVVALAVLAPSSVWAYRQVGWQTPAGQDISKVVNRAVYTYHAFDRPPKAYREASLIPMRVIREERKRAFSTARSLYAGRELARWLRLFRQFVSRDAYASSLRFAPGRVVSIRRGDLTLLPNSADASVRVVEQSSDGVATVWDHTYHLVATSGGWRIDKVSEYCPYGCG